jgi:uncharacterized protein DUF3703
MRFRKASGGIKRYFRVHFRPFGAGQLFRLIAIIPGYLFGWVPIGDTGGADVSAIRSMPIPEDLTSRLEHFDIWSAVAQWLRA